MKAQIKLTGPEDVEVTITLTMTVRQWKVLLSLLPNAYPCWALSNVIRRLVDKAEAHFAAEEEVDL